MKKILLCLVLICFSICIFAKTYTISNSYIKIDLNVENNNLTQITSIKDVKNNVEFMNKPSEGSSLWFFSLKKDKDFAGEEIILNSASAKGLKVDESPNSLTLNYSNVSSSKSGEAYNVIVKITLKDNNSYWDISINPEGTQKLGFWEITYPNVYGLDAQNGDTFMLPSKGDVFINKFDDPNGFADPNYDTNALTKYYQCEYPKHIQYSSFTKGNSTLYLSPEDVDNYSKIMKWSTKGPFNMNAFVSYQPEYMGIAGHNYVQKNHYNIAVVSGDWYDAAKKYRKWGIDNNYSPFSRGLIESRKDLPNWWKNLNLMACVSLTGSDDLVNSTIKAQETFKSPVLAHLYAWSVYPFDTHYPDWLPISDTAKTKIETLKKAGIYLMPYTNGHIVDSGLSETVKKTNNYILRVKQNGKFYSEPYQVELGADNNVVCIGSDYSNILLNEETNIFKAYPFDALYIDQISCSQVGPCFAEGHNHPVGGGNFTKVEYNNLLNNIKKNVKKATGKDIVITSEDGGDPFLFEGWVKCNEGPFKCENSKVRGTIFSGYVYNFGDTISSEEYKDTSGLSVANRISTVFTKGYLMGWEFLQRPEFWKNENAVKYATGAINCRIKYSNFFNFGEIIRDVNITSENPTNNVIWYHSSSKTKNIDCRTIKTISYFYKGKVLVVITNANSKPCKVDWNSDLSSLIKKDTYKISRVYPTKDVIEKSTNKVSNSFEIKPLETVAFIIE